MLLFSLSSQTMSSRGNQREILLNNLNGISMLLLKMSQAAILKGLYSRKEISFIIYLKIISLSKKEKSNIRERKAHINLRLVMKK